jgi:hypothetical protein
MDLNRSQTNEAISMLPLRLRTDRSIGLFGARRGGPAGGLARVHEGVDLLADEGERVFAVARGKVVLVTAFSGGTLIAIRHDPPASGIVSRYLHLKNPVVAAGNPVVAGQQIAEVGPEGKPDHLHFEIRQLPDITVSASGNSNRSHPLDPTRALYNWEKHRFENDQSSRRVGKKGKITLFDEVVRDRMLRFVRVNSEGSSDDYFLPLLNPTSEERSLLDTLRMAFFYKNNVRLVWRDSLFFADVQPPLLKLLVEVQVFC